MASFVVLTPPDRVNARENATFIRDGFSLLALIFPFFWLLWYRLWFAAILLLLISVGLAFAIEALPQWSPVAIAASVLLSAYVALEGNGMRIANKERQDWTIDAIIEAQNVATAEEIYFSDNSDASPTTGPGRPVDGKAGVWPSQPAYRAVAPEPGLLDLQGKR